MRWTTLLVCRPCGREVDAAASVGRRPSAEVRVPLVWADDVAARVSANRLWRLVVGEPGRVDLLHVAGAQFIEPIAD
jgi:hypothetical protein